MTHPSPPVIDRQKRIISTICSGKCGTRVATGVVRIEVREGETVGEALKRHTREGNEQQRHNL